MRYLGRILFIAIIGFAQSLHAGTKMKIPKLKRIGALKLEVIDQTKPKIFQVNGPKALVRQFYIARWGVHRYEYGVVEYLCIGGRCEMISEPNRLAVFEECTGFKSGRPQCKNLVASCDDILHEQLGEGAQTPWYQCEGAGAPCDQRDPLDEFPPRYSVDPDFGGLSP